MVKLKVTDKGLIAYPGSGFDGAFTSVPTQTKTASATLTAVETGVTILSASQGALTLTLPTAAASAGLNYIIRSSSPSAHVVTSSQDAGNVICVGLAGTLNESGSNASSVTFPAVVNSSLVLLSDGANWCVLANSGSMTYAKGA
jgi:hypothetical protein